MGPPNGFSVILHLWLMGLVVPWIAMVVGLVILSLESGHWNQSSMCPPPPSDPQPESQCAVTDQLQG